MKFPSIRSLITTIFSIILSCNLAWGIELTEKPTVASFSIGADFSSGSYKSESTTRRIYMPLVVNYYPYERLDLSVELPFIYQKSSVVTASATTTEKSVTRGPGSGVGIHTTVPISSVQTNATPTTIAQTSTTPANTVPATPLETNALIANTITTYSNQSPRNSAVSGLGDIILRGGYILKFEDSFIPQLRTSIFVKTPTASVSEGLGSGEFDFGGGFDFTKWLGNLRLAGEAVYNYQGKVTDLGLKNYLNYSGTIGYQVTDNIQPMLVLNGATALSVYDDDLLEVRGRLFWNLASATAIDLFASRGVSKSSPDYAGGFAVIYSF